MWQAKRLGTLGVFVRHPPMPLTLVARASSSSRTAAHMHVTSCSRVSNVEHHHELRFNLRIRLPWSFFASPSCWCTWCDSSLPRVFACEAVPRADFVPFHVVASVASLGTLRVVVWLPPMFTLVAQACTPIIIFAYAVHLQVACGRTARALQLSTVFVCEI